MSTDYWKDTIHKQVNAALGTVQAPAKKKKPMQADWKRWGAEGGRKSRRKLTIAQARAMVRSRERKRKERAALDKPAVACKTVGA